MKKDSMNKIINDSWGFAEARILNTCLTRFYFKQF